MYRLNAVLFATRHGRLSCRFCAVKVLGNPRQWSAEAWFGILGAAAWAALTGGVGYVRSQFDPGSLDFLPSLSEWVLFTVGLISVVSFALLIAALRRQPLAPVVPAGPDALPDLANEVATIVTRQIGEAVANRQYRIIPIDARPVDPPPFEKDGFLIWARTEPLHLSWTDLRDELRGPEKLDGLTLTPRPFSSYFSSSPIWVTITIRKQEQGYSSGLRLTFVEAKMRAGRFSTGGDSTAPGPSGPDTLDLMDDGAAPREQRVMVNDLKTGESWSGEFLCEGATWSNEPNNFGWVLSSPEGLRIAGSLKDILRA